MVPKREKSTDRNQNLISSEQNRTAQIFIWQKSTIYSNKSIEHDLTDILDPSIRLNYYHGDPEGDKDTLACQISGHSSNGLSEKCLETPNMTSFKN